MCIQCIGYIGGQVMLVLSDYDVIKLLNENGIPVCFRIEQNRMFISPIKGIRKVCLKVVPLHTDFKYPVMQLPL